MRSNSGSDAAVEPRSPVAEDDRLTKRSAIDKRVRGLRGPALRYVGNRPCTSQNARRQFNGPVNLMRSNSGSDAAVEQKDPLLNLDLDLLDIVIMAVQRQRTLA
jgi:hypothetical protein